MKKYAFRDRYPDALQWRSNKKSIDAGDITDQGVKEH